jgi:hypothetical protein
MTPTDKLELQVTEGEDGGATVVLPPGEAPNDNVIPQEVGSDALDQSDEGNSSQESDSNDGLDADPDREAIREARREERKLKKQIHREKAKESNHLINALKRQNQELAERLAVIEKKTSGAELARVDKAIEDAGVQVEYAKMKMREAVSAADGDGVARAEELLYEARRKLESLSSLKHNATRQNSQPKQNIQVPDPMVQKLAADWMERNSWYNPNGSDMDSEIAQRLDKKLTEEGYDPASEDYWDELDDRIKKYMPHKANSGYNDSSVRNQRPRSVVTSSGRESTATTKSNEFRLSPDRVAAMKEAGFWDNPAARQKAIRKYAEWDRANKVKGN